MKTSSLKAILIVIVLGISVASIMHTLSNDIESAPSEAEEPTSVKVISSQNYTFDVMLADNKGCEQLYNNSSSNLVEKVESPGKAELEGSKNGVEHRLCQKINSSHYLESETFLVYETDKVLGVYPQNLRLWRKSFTDLNDIERLPDIGLSSAVDPN